VWCCVLLESRVHGRQLLEIALFTAVMQRANPSRSTRRDPDPPAVTARRSQKCEKGFVSCWAGRLDLNWRLRLDARNS
jgi:hypothetical protein